MYFAMTIKERFVAKLDAGSEDGFSGLMEQKFPFQRILDNIELAAVRYQNQTVSQCMFHRFGDEVPSETEIELCANRIISVLKKVGKFRLVQVYTVARKPATRGSAADKRFRDDRGSSKSQITRE